MKTNFKALILLLVLSSTLSAISICTDKQGIQELRNGILSKSIYAKDVYCQGDTIYLVVEVNDEIRQALTSPRLSNQVNLYLRNQMKKACHLRNQLVSALRTERGINYTCNIALVLSIKDESFTRERLKIIVNEC